MQQILRAIFSGKGPESDRDTQWEAVYSSGGASPSFSTREAWLYERR
jgi:hypothetical protein